MLINLSDVLLTIFIIFSLAFFITGNIFRFICWIKCRKTKKDIVTRFPLSFWGDEWGVECTKEEIANLKHIVKRFEEQHAEQ